MQVFASSVDQATEVEWNRILALFQDANVYQTWAYGAVSWGRRQLSHLVLRTGNEIVAAAQLRVIRLPILGRGVAYAPWGPLWRRKEQPADAAVLEEMTRALVQEYAHKRQCVLRIAPHVPLQDPEAELALAVWRRCGMRIIRRTPPYRSIRVDLSLSRKELTKRLHQKWRNQLNAASKSNLTVREGTEDELFGQFLGIYDEMMRRKRFDTTVDPRLFHRIQQQLPADQKMLILLAEQDGRAMAGLIGSGVGERGIYLLGATSDAGMKSKGSYLLQWEMMMRLQQRGCRWYDLGGINPERNPGVFHFKQGFGGEELIHPSRLEASATRCSSLCLAAAEALRESMAAAWRGSLGIVLSRRDRHSPAGPV
jgi:lipid II:glycine glycyltransferase (peptidoglycan interpeptide bridge formation enzyme)